MSQLVVGTHVPALGAAWRPRIAFGLLLSYFTLYGVVMGGQGVLWADLVLRLGLSKTAFGSAQFIAPLVSVTLMLLGSQLGTIVGKKMLAVVSMASVAVSMVGLGFAPTLWVLVGVMVLLGVGNGLTEIAMNGGAIDWEQATGRPVMNMFHASFSAGAVLGSSGAGLLLGAGLSYTMVFVAIAVLYTLLMLATLPVRYPPADDHTGQSGGISMTLRVMSSRWALIGLALIAALGVIGFITANLWQVIYLREIGASSFVGGMSLALFNGSMFAGRLFNTPLVARYGPWTSLLVSGVGMILAALVLLLPGGVPVAVLAFMILGVACAGTVPTALSVGARLVPGRSSAITGGIMSVPYIANMLVPGMIGWVADNFSLRLALMVVGLSGAAIVLLVLRLQATSTAR